MRGDWQGDGVEHLWNWYRARHTANSSAAKTANGSAAATPQTAPDSEASNTRHAIGERLADPSRRYFFRAASVLAGAAPFAGAVYGFAAERLKYQVRRIEIPIANLPPAIDGIVVASLLHADVAVDHSPTTDLAARARSSAAGERLSGIDGIFGTLPDAAACMPSASALPTCSCACSKARPCADQKSVTAFE